MIYNFQNTKNPIWRYYLSMLFRISGVVGLVLLFIFFQKGFLLKLPLLITSAFIFTFHLIPLSLLYFNHRSRSRGMNFYFDSLESKYRISDIQGNRFDVMTTDILSVTKVVSPATFHDRVDWSGFGAYHYWILTTKGHEFLISCLLCDEDEAFDPSKLSVKKAFFPFLPKKTILEIAS
jgi:hypothetical protein